MPHPVPARPRRQALTQALTAVAAFAAMTVGTGVAHADNTWPARPVRLVVGYAPGGATDQIARIVATRLAQQTGQPVVVENKAGANSNVAAETVARAAPDGHTLYVYTVANTINATLYAKLGYDPIKDFEPIGLMAKIANIFVVNPAVPAQNVAEFQHYVRSLKDGVMFASSGAGSSIHLSGELFKSVSRLNMVHVPYRGSAPAITDLLGGQVQLMFDNAPSALPHIKAGKLRALAVTSARRLPQLPQVPTLAESGFPGFDVQSWFGLAAPAGTPRAVIEQASAALARAVASPDVATRLQDLAATPEPSSAEQMRRHVAAEVLRWRDVVRASGAQAD